jgi:hypothetical protein
MLAYALRLAAVAAFLLGAVHSASLAGPDAHSAAAASVVGPDAHRSTFDSTFALEVDPQLCAELVAEVDSTAYTVAIQELSGWISTIVGGQSRRIITRSTYLPDHLVAADYLTERFGELGYSVVVQDFEVQEQFPTRNVVAVKEGRSRPEEIVVVGAHYDSRSGRYPYEAAPGAEDNASGVAAVLQLARLWSRIETERSVHFVCFAAEEQGLLGSRRYASSAAQEGWQLSGVLIMDMISNWENDYGVLVDGGTAEEALASLFETGAATWAPELRVERTTNDALSDQIAFQEISVPAILVIDMDWREYPAYHRLNDQYPNLEIGLGLDVLRTMTAALASLSGARDRTGVPVMISQLRALRHGEDVRLRWEMGASPPEAQILVWRRIPGRPWTLRTSAPLRPRIGVMEFTDADAPVSELRYRLELHNESPGHAAMAQSVDVGPRSDPLADVVLHRSRPNPFNPRTTIRYDVSRPSAVELTIHDLRGRLVRRLRPWSAVDPGSYEIDWDGRDDRGVAVGSGGYLCVLRSPAHVESQSLVVVR